MHWINVDHYVWCFDITVKDKADVLKQVEDLTNVKDELTAEVMLNIRWHLSGIKLWKQKLV